MTYSKPSKKLKVAFQKAKKIKKFTEDLRTKRAVERNLEIIGESVNRVQNKEHSINISNARTIVDTQIKIIMDMTKFQKILFGELL